MPVEIPPHVAIEIQNAIESGDTVYAVELMKDYADCSRILRFDGCEALVD